MAFEAGCGASKVLEAGCVTTAVGFLVPGGCRAVMDVQARRLHHNRLLNLVAPLWCGRLARTGRTVVDVQPRRLHHKAHQDVWWSLRLLRRADFTFRVGELKTQN